MAGHEDQRSRHGSTQDNLSSFIGATLKGSPSKPPGLPRSPAKLTNPLNKAPSVTTTTGTSAGQHHPSPDPKAPAKLKPKSNGVAAALAAVLNKHDKTIKGLSSAPDESLHKDKVNKDVLAKMRETFSSADRDGTGELSREEFVESFVGVLQTEDGADEGALGKLFMRIDANSDGTVDWDEFSTFMLLESQGSANLRDQENSISFEQAEDMKVPEDWQHDKIITHISHAHLRNGSDRYVTCSKDGTIKVWNAKDLKLLRTLPVGSGWVTSAKMLPTTHKLAVTSFSRCCKIFDMQTYEQCGQIPEIEYAPMAMDVWSPARKKDVEMVVFGDGGGFVRLYELQLNPLEDKTSNDRYLDLVKWKHQHHTDWVTCIKYVEEINTVIAGSLDKCISLSDAEDRMPVKILEGHVKGVSALDWSPAYKFIVSGSQDRRLMLWNPFSLKPLATLMGHLSSVTAVATNDRDNQIISLSADKQLKLWDIRNHKCIQTLTDRELIPGVEEDTLLAAAYDSKRKQLITGNVWPKAWRQTITAAASCGHKAAVVRVLYNPLFDEAITADQTGTISVWFVPTGKLRFRFGNTHPGQNLTALNFDSAKRRLLTGCENGEVKVWNFSSGACLCTLRPKTHEEVTSILTLRGSVFKHFVVAGWDLKITCFEDPGPGQRETFPGRIIPGHQADILDMAVMEGSQVLVSVSDDGEVCTWNMDSGALRRRTSPPGQADLPMNQQGIEKVAFLHGKLRHVFVTVGADRWLRFWDCGTTSILAEVFTGHMLGETVQGLTIHPNNTLIATGDGAGFIKVWDISEFTGVAMAVRVAKTVVREQAVWRAHKKAITSLDWASEGKFLLSSSSDNTASLWSEDGRFVGQFGAHVWLLDMPKSWRAEEPFPLTSKEVVDMNMSRTAPRRPVPSQLGASSDVVSSPRGNRFSTALSTQSRPGSPPSAGFAEPSYRSGPRVSMMGVPPDAAQPSLKVPGIGGLSMLRDRDQGLLSSRSQRPTTLLSSRTMNGRPGSRENTPGQSVRPSIGHVSDANRQSKVSIQWPADDGGGQGTARSGDESQRPVTGLSEVAKVLAASHQDRLRRVNSVRRAERPEDFEPGGRYSRAQSMRKSMMGPASKRFDTMGSFGPGGSEQGSDDEDDEDDLLEESSSSGDHASDEDVPRALWLEQFRHARHTKPAAQDHHQHKHTGRATDKAHSYMQGIGGVGGKPSPGSPGKLSPRKG